MTDADYADDIALLANAPAQARIYVLYQTGEISTLNGSSLKLVDKFTYLGSSVLSTETDIDTWLAKPWTATIGYRSYESHKMKHSYFQAVVV